MERINGTNYYSLSEVVSLLGITENELKKYAKEANVRPQRAIGVLFYSEHSLSKIKDYIRGLSE